MFPSSLFSLLYLSSPLYPLLSILSPYLLSAFFLSHVFFRLIRDRSIRLLHIYIGNPHTALLRREHQQGPLHIKLRFRCNLRHIHPLHFGASVLTHRFRYFKATQFFLHLYYIAMPSCRRSMQKPAFLSRVSIKYTKEYDWEASRSTRLGVSAWEYPLGVSA